ncbi:hypothetical protein LNP20_02655 [Klebsiella pneumoniae subsp. pneumoniae]|nr:hypothetical protein [Klebsiella pneumoniae subsp. pneumoniae]
MEGQGVALRAYNQPETLLAWLALLQCGARVLPLNPQLPAVLLQELLPALTVQHQLVLNGDTLPGEFTGVNSAGGRRRLCRLLAWRSVGVDDVDLRFNRPAESGGTCSANSHLASAAGVLALMPFAAGDDWLLSLPLFHVSGQGSSGAGCWPARDSRYVTNSRWRRCCTAVPMLRWCRLSYGAC